MIMDKDLIMLEDQAVVSSSVNSDVIDLGADDTKLASYLEKGEMDVLAQVSTAFTEGTSVAVKLQTDLDPAFGTAEDIVSTAAVPVASLVAGYQFRLGKLAPGIKRYLRAVVTPVGTFATGKLTIALVADKQTN